MINTPLIEIELQPTAPAFSDSAGERLGKWNSLNSHTANHSHSTD